MSIITRLRKSDRKGRCVRLRRGIRPKEWSITAVRYAGRPSSPGLAWCPSISRRSSDNRTDDWHFLNHRNSHFHCQRVAFQEFQQFHKLRSQPVNIDSRFLYKPGSELQTVLTR